VGEYDKSQPLIIDPLVLVYSTYLGGADSDFGYGIAVDNSGYVHVIGSSSSTDFPISNQYMSDPGDGSYDVFVSKLDTTQSGTSSLVYSTYLGGGGEDRGNDIAVDTSGYTYITGGTSSTDFPTLNQYMSDPGDGASDVFVTKLDTTQSGTSSLVYSTYLGGANSDYGFGIAADNSAYAYVTGHVYSTDFPCLNQYQGDQGGYDTFVTKLDTTQSGSSCLLYSTYLGGGHYDYGKDITVNNSGFAYVTGYTGSTDFPTLNQYMSDSGDGLGDDVFVTKINTTQSGASSLLYSTYLGGGDSDIGCSIALDSSGYTYVTGYISSTDFPTLNQYMSDPGDGNKDGFVTKLDTTQSGAFSLLYSTYLGGGDNDYGLSIAVDNSGYTYLSGSTDSTDFPCLYEYQTFQGGGDVFVTKLDTTQSGTDSLLYSTYLGGGALETGLSMALDNTGNVYVAGDTYSTDFPTINHYQTNQGGLDAFVIRLAWATLGVTSPNGGEDWALNTIHNITWDATGLSIPLYIVLQQNGVNVALINKNIDPSLGTYSWKVGDYRLGAVVANANCKILLKHKDSTLKDKSDAVFTISNPYVTVTAPNGGEDWQIGTTENITWDSAGLTNTLYIVLQQNGVNVALIQKIIDPSLGTYSWSVGDCRLGSVVAGSNYKIIIKEKDSTVKDKSDGLFVISN
jgi:hypothetical protein